MTGSCIIKRLNKSGNYKSALDSDPCFVDLNNPNGFFKLIVQPIENSYGQPEIRYCKVPGGYRVSGEGYFIGGFDEKEVDEKCHSHFEVDRWPGLVQTEVAEEKDLW